MKQDSVILAIDFDATCVFHDYPEVGKDVPGAVDILKKLIRNKHRLMLWTMRSGESETGTLADAVNWFKRNDIELWGVNENPDQKRTGWSLSNKQYANIFVDDAALGCPLIYDLTIHNRPFVDWVKVDKMFEEMGLYKKEENKVL